MTQIDFYLLSQADKEGFVCRLVEKIYLLNKRAHLHTHSEQSAQQLNNRLWQFRDDSFIPHGLYDPETAEENPITIGFDAEPSHPVDVLLNLTNEVPRFFSRFDRLAEIVASSEEEKAKARERFRFYKERGYEIKTHKIN